MQQKEKWIEDVMQSLKGMQPAESNPFLHTRIMAKLQDAVVNKVPVRWALASAFGFLLLLWFNVRVFTAGNRNAAQQGSGIEQVVKEYGLSSNDIYNDSK